MKSTTINGGGSSQKKFHRIKSHRVFLAVWGIFLWTITLDGYAQKPDLFLLNTYQKSDDVIGWVMSEKYDGVRAYWDGHQLISRGGLVFNAPEEFLRNFPAFELDGELWTKRNDFENIVSIVRQQQPDERWSQITYRVFEVPQQPGGLLARLAVLQSYLQARDLPMSMPDAATLSSGKQQLPAEQSVQLSIIAQIEIKSQAHLEAFFQQVVSQGGEGVVVRDPAAAYQTGRLNDALKVKPYQDADCEVTGYRSGNGKYQGLAGAIKCRLADQTVIRIGSGLSDFLRKNPPAIGSTITFKYYGLTRKRLPRFPVFLRRRTTDVEGK